MLDLHCHLLVGVDDGAPDDAQAVAMAEALLRAGFTQIAASPHTGEGPGGNVDASTAEAARGRLRELLHTHKLDLEILENAEHHVTSAMLERVQSGAVAPIGGNSKWLLVELPWHATSDVEASLFRIQLKGYRLLLAHPERYNHLEIDVIERLAQRGVAMQLELGSFAGVYGKRAQHKALTLADRALGHVLATDLHRPDDALAWIDHAKKNIAARYGKRAVELGLSINPSAILNNADSDAVSPFSDAASRRGS